ncbi:MAG: hypothetical protein HZA88_03025 [Verrucomicrobia bacterium]|nr:hypothetical protein [Verrucomicrobiota bacterium]
MKLIHAIAAAAFLLSIAPPRAASADNRPPTPAEAQLQLVEVKQTNRKKDGRESRELAITIRNNGPQPVACVTLRWGIVRTHSSSPHTVAYGAEKTVDFKPLQTEVVHTGALSAPAGRIIGHGAQILVGAKVVVEQFFPDSVKPAFEKLKPLP